MNRASTMSRLERLDYITTRLKSEEPLNIANIAEELGVSVRTLSRDIQVLRQRGLPIEADRGRGGGVQLKTDWGIGRVNLNHSEAVDLLISLAVAEQMNSPLLMANLSSVRQKLMASFAPSVKLNIKKLKSRILIGKSASPFVLTGFSAPKASIVEPLHQAFLTMQEISIKYCAESGDITKRIIEPHFLMLSYPIWYVLAWDQLRDDIRFFRCDRIKTAHRLDKNFQLRSVSAFKNVIECLDAIEP